MEHERILAPILESAAAPIREKGKQLRANPGEVDEILAARAAWATISAAGTMELVASRVGIRPLNRTPGR